MVLCPILFFLGFFVPIQTPSVQKRKPTMNNETSSIVVAVIDTGIDLTHKDLATSLWQNPREIPDNGIDDDQNGFIDDVHGWNFTNGTPIIQDRHGHGTHIAGIIHEAAPGARIMVLKYYDSKDRNPTNSLSGTIRAIRYAVAMGAKIINFSGGGLEPDREEKAAIADAQTRGVLFVAAAGNERSNSDHRPFYPAGYNLDNILSVTAVDRDQMLLPSSNYGVRTVDIAAQGANVVSTIPFGRFGTMTGTSQATAFVTGAAARLMAERTDLRTPEVVRTQLLATGLSVKYLVGKTRKHSVLDVENARMMVGAQTSAFGHFQKAAESQFVLSTDH